MNKHELKSLLENIYHLLAEEDLKPHNPPVGTPDSLEQGPPDPEGPDYTPPIPDGFEPPNGAKGEWYFYEGNWYYHTVTYVPTSERPNGVLSPSEYWWRWTPKGWVLTHHPKLNPLYYETT